MDRRRSPASFDSTAPTFSHFSTSLAQKLRAAKKIPAPEEEDKAVERAKAARFEDYLRKTAPGILVPTRSSTSNLESTTTAFLESLTPEETLYGGSGGGGSSSSSSSRRGSTHSTHSHSIPDSRHSVTPLMSRRRLDGDAGGRGVEAVSGGKDFLTSSRRSKVSSAISSPSLHLLSSIRSSSSSSTIATSNSSASSDNNYITKSTLPPAHLRRRFTGGTSDGGGGVVRLVPADHEGFSALRRLLKTLFQTDYNDAFFRDVREAAQFSRLALIDGKSVGVIACRLQDNADGDRYRPLEVMIVAMGVLQENRRRGIGTKLLSHVAETAYRNDQIGRLRLAVHKDNASAIKLYEKMGFERINSSHDVWTMAYQLRASLTCARTAPQTTF